MKRCSYCGSELNANALYCPKCLVPIAQTSRRRRPGTLPLLLGVSLIFGGPCAWVLGGQFRSQFLKASISHSTVHAAAISKPRAVNQAKVLIQSCGTPSRDVSTAYNDPRPPIPFREIDYSSQHLQFAFVPGGGAKIGDPPPYRWALSGVVDSTTNQRISLQEAADRMSCASSLTALADAAHHSSSASASAQASSGNPSIALSSAADPQ